MHGLLSPEYIFRGGFERNSLDSYFPVLTSPPDPNSTLTPFTIDLDRTWYLRPGVEWHLPITESSLFFFGSDIQFLTVHNGYDYIIGDFSRWTKISTSYKVFKGSVIGFVGAKYHPRDWVSLSIESSVDISYQIIREWVYDVSMEGEKRLNNKAWQNRFLYNYHPILLVNLSFHF
jgi:hypothetical protein